MSYLNGYADREFMEELPRFRLPALPGPGTYRAFEAADDSMLPLTKGTTIVGRYVEHWADLKNGTPCIVVSCKEGILFKRLYVEGDTLNLRADNPLQADCQVQLVDVLEIWEAKSYISSAFPIGAPSLENLASLVLDLTQQVNKMQTERGPMAGVGSTL